MKLPITAKAWEKLAKKNGADMFVLSHLEHSRKFYRVGLVRFGEFCRERKVRSITDKSVYAILLDFARWNDAKGLRGKTIRGYIWAVRAFLTNSSRTDKVKINRDQYKGEVQKWIPKIKPILEDGLTLTKIRTLLTKGRPNKKMLALVLLILSSGVRLAEALALEIKDLDLAAPIATVQVSGEYSKTTSPEPCSSAMRHERWLRKSQKGDPLPIWSLTMRGTF